MWRTVLLIALRPFALLIYIVACGLLYCCAFLFFWAILFGPTGDTADSAVWKRVRAMRIGCREILLPPISRSAKV